MLGDLQGVLVYTCSVTGTRGLYQALESLALSRERPERLFFALFSDFSRTSRAPTMFKILKT